MLPQAVDQYPSHLSISACRRLYTFALHKPDNADARWQLQQRGQLDCSGIFDMRWAPHTASPLLALALANGSVQMLQLGESEGDWQEAATADVALGMVLTVDWARHVAHAGRAVSSTSTGHLAVLQVCKHIVGTCMSHHLHAGRAYAAQPELTSSVGACSGSRGQA